MGLLFVRNNSTCPRRVGFNRVQVVLGKSKIIATSCSIGDTSINRADAILTRGSRGADKRVYPAPYIGGRGENRRDSLESSTRQLSISFIRSGRYDHQVQYMPNMLMDRAARIFVWSNSSARSLFADSGYFGASMGYGINWGFSVPRGTARPLPFTPASVRPVSSTR